MILSLLTMEDSALTNELLRQFGLQYTTATSSALFNGEENPTSHFGKSFSRDSFKLSQR